MEDLKLEKNEGILLITTEAWSYFNDNELTVDTLYLTNQNLISVYKKSKGIFSKRETVIDKVPLTSISIINNVVQVKKVIDDDYGESLQIIFDGGKKELLKFTESPKKEYQQWKVAISNAVLECNGKRNTDIQDETIVQNSSVAEINETVNLNIKETRFCSFCGTKLDPGARFCKSCGTPLETVRKSKQIEEPCKEDQYQQSTYSERKQEFVGKIIKCPNCGEVLKSFMANCPSCGYEIRGIKASSTVREFTLKLEQIEAQKMPVEKEQKSVMETILGRDFKREADIEASAKKRVEEKKRFDEQKNKEKANLIRNFSVPNTKEDILEFLILSSSNISDKHSMNDIVSKAWISKLEQVYQKARILYINDSDFSKIQDIYNQVHSKVVSKKKIEIVTKNIGVWCGLIALIVAVIVDISGGNSSMIELVGCILLIFSASILEKRDAYFLEFGIGAISGVITIGLSFLLDNGSMLELCGGIILIVVAVNFFRSIINNH